MSFESGALLAAIARNTMVEGSAMCRMILATGTFDPRRIVDAAVSMATGSTADHEAWFPDHPNGWGAIWHDPTTSTRISALRDIRPIADSERRSELSSLKTGFLAIHVRRAMPPTLIGLEFTHPLQREADDWLFMHNGSQPTVHRMLGRSESVFDSAEYFDYLVPACATELEPDETVRRLQEIPEPGGNSGNAIAAREDRAYLIHWRSPNDTWPNYFTMQELRTPKARIISSEVIPWLAPRREWQPVAPQSVLELSFS